MDILNIVNSYSKYHLVLSEVRVIMFICIYYFYYFEHVHFISFFLIIKHILSVTNVWTLSHVSMAACFMISVANMIQLIRRMTMDRLGLLCRNIYEDNKMTQRGAGGSDGSFARDLQPSREGWGWHRSSSRLIRLRGLIPY